MATSIEWTDATWNPVTGCSKVSPGCAHCYAERLAPRVFAGQKMRTVGEGLVPEERPRRFEDVWTHEDRLDAPLHWKKPRRVFVNSMSDLFHEDVPDSFIDKVFAVMALARQHTFQVLTKRAERMRAYLAAVPSERWAVLAREMGLQQWPLDGQPQWVRTVGPMPVPVPNVWLGVSVENQHFADERIPLLLQTPAAVRFISAEPLLGPVLLDDGCHSWLSCTSTLTQEQFEAMTPEQQGDHHCCESWDASGWHFHGIDWVIVGGESGPGARRMDLAWARAIVAQCKAAGVPVFVKQLGAAPLSMEDRIIPRDKRPLPAGRPDGFYRYLSDRKGGDPSEWPEDLRVREFP